MRYWISSTILCIIILVFFSFGVYAETQYDALSRPTFVDNPGTENDVSYTYWYYTDMVKTVDIGHGTEITEYDQIGFITAEKYSDSTLNTWYEHYSNLLPKSIKRNGVYIILSYDLLERRVQQSVIIG